MNLLQNQTFSGTSDPCCAWPQLKLNHAEGISTTENDSVPDINVTSRTGGVKLTDGESESKTIWRSQHMLFFVKDSFRCIYLPKKATFMCLRASTSFMMASLSAYAWISNFWSGLAMCSKALFPHVSVQHKHTNFKTHTWGARERGLTADKHNPRRCRVLAAGFMKTFHISSSSVVTCSVFNLSEVTRVVNVNTRLMDGVIKVTWGLQ